MKERKSVLKSPGEGGQDKHTSQGNRRLEDSRCGAARHCHGGPRGWAGTGQGKRPGQGPFYCSLLSARPASLGTGHSVGEEGRDLVQIKPESHTWAAGRAASGQGWLCPGAGTLPSCSGPLPGPHLAHFLPRCPLSTWAQPGGLRERGLPVFIAVLGIGLGPHGNVPLEATAWGAQHGTFTQGGLVSQALIWASCRIEQ